MDRMRCTHHAYSKLLDAFNTSKNNLFFSVEVRGLALSEGVFTACAPQLTYYKLLASVYPTLVVKAEQRNFFGQTTRVVGR